MEDQIFAETSLTSHDGNETEVSLTQEKDLVLCIAMPTLQLPQAPSVFGDEALNWVGDTPIWASRASLCTSVLVLQTEAAWGSVPIPLVHGLGPVVFI